LLTGYRRIAVQVHGRFWHRCPEHFHAPKADADWWRLKLESVVARDAHTERQLAAAGDLPIVVWEQEDMSDAAQRLQVLDMARRPPLSAGGVAVEPRSAAPAGWSGGAASVSVPARGAMPPLICGCQAPSGRVRSSQSP
jgi:hypothetical protein